MPIQKIFFLNKVKNSFTFIATIRAILQSDDYKIIKKDFNLFEDSNGTIEIAQKPINSNDPFDQWLLDDINLMLILIYSRFAEINYQIDEVEAKHLNILKSIAEYLKH